jgi:hypothetical protein
MKAHVFMFNKCFPRKSCRLWDNVEKYGTVGQATDDSIIRRMRFACWITKAKSTHSEYVILIAFPRQRWLSERASILRYAHIACLVVCHCYRKRITHIYICMCVFHNTGCPLYRVAEHGSAEGNFNNYRLHLLGMVSPPLPYGSTYFVEESRSAL